MQRGARSLLLVLAGAAAMLSAGVSVGRAQPPPAAAASVPPRLRHVLLMDDRAPHRPTALQWLEGMTSVLDTSASPAPTVFTEAFDLGRLGAPSSTDRLVEWITTKYAGIEFDLIIAFNETAVGIAQQLRATWGRDVPLVGVWYGPRSATRIASLPRIANSVPVMLAPVERPFVQHIRQLLPQLRELLVIAPSPREATALAAEVTAEVGPDVRVEPIGAPSLGALRARVATLSPDAALLYYAVTRDADGRAWSARNFLRELRRISPRPIFSYVPTYLGAGIVGGPLEDPRQQGAAVAALGLQLVRGGPGTAIPPVLLTLTRVVYDWDELQRFDIPRRRLDQTATFINRPILVWEQYPRTAALVSALFLALAAVLLVVVRRSRELRQAQADRLAITQRLLRTQDEERVRIAHDLHDDLCQEMTALALEVEHPHRTALTLPEVATRIRRLNERTREVAHGLNAGHAGAPFPDALAAFAANLQARTGLNIKVVADAWAVTPPPEVALTLLRVVQEALQNVLKHADATAVTIRLTARDDASRVTVTVTDDGIGLPPDVASSAGHGLGIMRERMAGVGGRCSLRSTPFEGTCVTLDVPLTPGAT